MLDIPTRVLLINSLIGENTNQSLTYAALECRLTLEYLCYERFQFFYSYLSSNDLKGWQPKHIIKQISDDIDESIAKGLSLSISRQSDNGHAPKTVEDFESLEYIPLGEQSELDFNRLHRLWHGLANVALHIPVPDISSGKLSIYRNKEKIKSKVLEVIDFLSTIQGNLLMGGPIGEVYSFECLGCDALIKKPVKYLKRPTVASCINPKCPESYLIQQDDSGELEVIRRIIRFPCKGCNASLEVPAAVFRELRFDQQLNIRCAKCDTSSKVIMRPCMKSNESEN